MADQSSISKAELKIGMRVAINPRFDKTRTKLVTGTIEKILTNTDTHPHGILVALQDGEIGRVKKIPPNTLTRISTSYKIIKSCITNLHPMTFGTLKTECVFRSFSDPLSRDESIDSKADKKS